MKKHKLHIMLGLLTICLCLATLVVGVYSVKKLQLTTSGSIGFTIHSSEVNVVGSVSGAIRGKNLNFAEVDNNTYSGQGSTGNQTWTDRFEKQTEDDDKNLLAESDSWVLGEIYFNDFKDTISPITISFVITNYSSFPVKASVELPQISNVSTAGSVSEIYLNTYDDVTPKTGTVEIVLTLIDKNVEVSLSDLNLNLSIENTTMPTLASDLGTLSESSTQNTLILNKKDLAPNENNELVIPSIVTNSNGDVVNVDIVRFWLFPQGMGNFPCISGNYNLIISEGIKGIELPSMALGLTIKLNSIYIPSTINQITVGSNWNCNIYEICNNSSQVITRGAGLASSAVSIHTGSSLIKSTSDELTYIVDSDNSISYILNAGNSSSITIPAKIDGYDCLLINDTALIDYSGKVYSTNANYSANGDVLYNSEGNALCISGAETITIPAGVTNIIKQVTMIAITLIKDTTKTVNIETGNTVYGSNGDVIYKLSDNNVIWASQKSTITIPSAVTYVTVSYIKSGVEQVLVESGNETYASNGYVVYKISDGTVVWTSSAVETLDIPEGVRVFPSISSKKYTAINIPASMETIPASNIPSTVTSITVASGNSNFAISEGKLIKLDDNSVIWSPSNT